MKLIKHINHALADLSPPAWGRGLKQDISKQRQRVGVAPRVGAWIETDPSACLMAAARSPPAWGRGLKRRRHGGCC